MDCIYYKNDILHSLPENEQQEHLKSCLLCQERKEFEDQIMFEAGQLNPLKPESILWDKIESSIRAETNKNRSNIFRKVPKSRIWLSAAALFIAILSLSVFYLFFNASGKILSDSALLRVEYTEQNYLEAIQELEAEAIPKIAELNTDLMLLYRDKLETINSQINRCRLAIKNNPGNAHIRRYMLAALQDKKETLMEILEI